MKIGLVKVLILGSSKYGSIFADIWCSMKAEKRNYRWPKVQDLVKFQSLAYHTQALWSNKAISQD